MASSDQYPYPEDTKETAGTKHPSPHLLPFPIQLINIFAIEIVARRFPVPLDSTLTTNSNLRLEEVQVEQETQQAQAILHVSVEVTSDPKPFEISFRLVGLFSYPMEMDVEAIQQFLNNGSLSIMLPFARETLVSLCVRLQVPLLLLQMIQINPPPALQE